MLRAAGKIGVRMCRQTSADGHGILHVQSPLRVWGSGSSVEEPAVLAGGGELIPALDAGVALSPSLSTLRFLQCEGNRLEGPAGLPTPQGTAAPGGVGPERLFWS